MDHYICTGGCDGVSAKPGVCQAGNCPNYQKPLQPCSCDEASHETTEEPETEI